MPTLHKSELIDNVLVPEEGQQALLCSNEIDPCCPSPGSNEASSKEKELVQLEYLASILVQAYLDKKYDQ